jgi:hypothetical protein
MTFGGHETDRLLDGPSFENDVATSQSHRRFSFTRRDSVLDGGLDASAIPLQTKLGRLLKRAYEYVRVDRWTMEQRVLMASVAVLVLATAGERITYKMAIDRLTPFRAALVIFVLGLSMLVYNTICFAKRAFTNDISEEMTKFSTKPLLLIALMDTVIFAIQTISASGVSPTMTVILLHANTPMIVWTSHFTFPDRKYGHVQNRGAQIIALAILISISRPIMDLLYAKNVSYATSTLFYVSASAVQGFVLLFKEKCLADYGKRMDAYYISACLFTYQFGIAVLLAPLMYLFQDLLSNSPTGFPMSSFWHNMQDGFSCLIGSYSSSEHEDGTEPYAEEYMQCEGNMYLTMGFVVATVMVLLCIDQVLYFKDQILGRALACSVLFAFCVLALYDYTHPYFGEGLLGNGSSVGLADLLSIAVLLLGMEIYGQDPEPDVEIITNYFKPVVQDVPQDADLAQTQKASQTQGGAAGTAAGPAEPVLPL